jgi:hypothetical protein
MLPLNQDGIACLAKRQFAFSFSNSAAESMFGPDGKASLTLLFPFPTLRAWHRASRVGQIKIFARNMIC